MCCCRKVNRKFEGGSHGYVFERSLPRVSRKEFLTMARRKPVSETQVTTSNVSPAAAPSPPLLLPISNNNKPKDSTARSLKLLCVRNLAKTTDASDLLHFLNQTLHRDPPQDRSGSNPPRRPPPSDIQNILVHNRVAILGCSTSEFVDSILQRLQAGSLGPIIYRGKTLEIGRPRNFVMKSNGESQMKKRHDRSMEGMVVVVTKGLDRK